MRSRDCNGKRVNQLSWVEFYQSLLSSYCLSNPVLDNPEMQNKALEEYVAL